MAKKFALVLSLEALDKVSAPLQRMQVRMESAVKPLQQLARGVHGLTVASGLPSLANASLNVGRGFRQFGAEAGLAVRRVALLSAAGATALGALVNSYTSFGDTIAKQAARIGIGVEALQELRFAAGREGIATDELDKGLLKLSRNLGDLKAGTGELFSTLGRNAPVLKAQLEASTDLSHAFDLVTDAISSTSDQMLRAHLAQAAFGRSGLKLLTLVQNGRAAISDLREEARALGVVIGDRSARDAEAMSDAFDNLRAATLGVRNALGASLLPALLPVVEEVTRLVVGLRPTIEAWARDFAATLPRRLEELRAGAQQLWAQLQPLVQVVQALVDRFGLATVAGAALGAQIFGPTLAALVSLGAQGLVLITNLGSVALRLSSFAGTLKGLLVPGLLAATKAVVALGTAILTTPVGWILAGIAAIVAAGWVLYENWDAIAEGLTSAWGWLVDVLEKAWGFVERIAGATIDAFVNPAGNSQVAVDAGRAGAVRAGDLDAAYAAGAARRGPGGEARVRVDFGNLPRGATVRTERQSGLGLQTRVGYNFEGP